MICHFWLRPNCIREMCAMCCKAYGKQATEPTFASVPKAGTQHNSHSNITITIAIPPQIRFMLACLFLALLASSCRRPGPFWLVLAHHHRHDTFLSYYFPSKFFSFPSFSSFSSFPSFPFEFREKHFAKKRKTLISIRRWKENEGCWVSWIKHGIAIFNELRSSYRRLIYSFMILSSLAGAFAGILSRFDEMNKTFGWFGSFKPQRQLIWVNVGLKASPPARVELEENLR